MEIKLDREKRVILLKALNQGSIDDQILNQWINHAADTMTLDEINAEITRLEKLDCLDGCHRRQKAGLCLMMNNQCNKNDKRVNNEI